MIKYIQLLILLIGLHVFGQEKEKVFNFEFENKDILELLLDIEKEAEVTFYFDKKWVDGKSYSGNFTKATLVQILGEVFEDTNLNIFVLN
ncbi:MAG: type II secretory pathway component GspD/PulD (secretin), partial [Candidatus Paceibacteria bacterium]